MKTALIIGASSGIGRALAKVLSQRGYRVGVVARRGELLATLQAELPAPSISRLIDGSDADRLQRRSTISNTISRMPRRAGSQVFERITKRAGSNQVTC